MKGLAFLQGEINIHFVLKLILFKNRHFQNQIDRKAQTCVEVSSDSAIFFKIMIPGNRLGHHGRNFFFYKRIYKEKFLKTFSSKRNAPDSCTFCKNISKKCRFKFAKKNSGGGKGHDESPIFIYNYKEKNLSKLLFT